ncbi:uncharacterized protein LOC128953026 [Oppia nitens]|uniref:uncharacterized protein LOC128953026 n=1 Tax=Oppia nitens TaxID=1686743 RepID=UPI0023DBAED7|nr:uncharacterized protein LOC128953026 [Oppia nitens]
MNRADEIRDQIRQMRYLTEEKKFIDDIIRKIDDQRNRLQLEEMTLRRIYNNTMTEDHQEYDELNDQMVVADDSNDRIAANSYLCSGTPSGAIEEPMVILDRLPIEDRMTNNKKKPNAVAETIELDVSKVLLRLACGGSLDNQQVVEEEEEEEEEEEDDEDY